MTHSLTVLSHPDYERLIVEIYIDDAFVCLLSQEESLENPAVEFPGGAPVQVSLREFEIALAAAKARLAELNRHG